MANPAKKKVVPEKPVSEEKSSKKSRLSVSSKKDYLKAFGFDVNTLKKIDGRSLDSAIERFLLGLGFKRENKGLHANVKSIIRAAQKETASVKPKQLIIKPPKNSLPELPKGLSWPTDTFSEAHKKYGWDIILYLEKRWLPILEAGRKRGRIFASRRLLATRDPSAITAISNYTRVNPKTGEQRTIPSYLHFPTLKEENDLALSSQTIQRGDASRLAVAAQRRGLRI